MWECIDFIAQLNAEHEIKQGMGLIGMYKGADPGIWLVGGQLFPAAGIANVTTKNKPHNHSG